MNRLENKVALITGASRGMGEAHAREFINQGAKVILADVREEMGEALAKELGENALFVKLDVTNVKDWENAVKQGEAKFGNINVLVNNAGILGPVAGVMELKYEDYLKVIDINQHSILLGMQAVIPSMLKAGVGSIINVSSIAGIVACFGFPNIAYMASKFAIRGMTKAVAFEYGPKNIRVNSMHPGFVLTPMMIEATDKDASKEGRSALDEIPLGRISETRDLTGIVVFLASEEASFITGQEHIVDGGMTIH
ncbi:SDR family NAD(P)-dependent oxidoreductase [Algoriphagus sp. Y33]|uniref:SDR family NAD(P)-dependent oxidoreductase n=1 Tax=Algoriphagus sp. Y33 TaxID=2772483 RepID=UPI0017869DF4|nr:glucose 1-dehydrogenase [Algoriphagus sp. Y33]